MKSDYKNYIKILPWYLSLKSPKRASRERSATRDVGFYQPIKPLKINIGEKKRKKNLVVLSRNEFVEFPGITKK